MYDKSGAESSISDPGKDKIDSSQVMNISSGNFTNSIDDLLTVLETLKIDPQSRKEVLSIADALKGQITGYKIRLKIKVSVPVS